MILSNFSWVIPNKLAASAAPFTEDQFIFLAQQGIRVIINLTDVDYTVEQSILDIFSIHQIKIPDFSTPSIEQVELFYKIVEEHESRNEPVLIHCFAGCGRTGTMLALYLMKSMNLSSTEAISKTRSYRECSIETDDQEKLIHTVYTELFENKT